MMTEMMTDEPIRDVASASAVLSQHVQCHAEIDAREDNFSSLVEAGQMLIQHQHYASEEVCIITSNTISNVIQFQIG